MYSQLLFDWYFNSQPHEEADGNTVVAVIGSLNISTHSLTKRLTASILLLPWNMKNFNSQPHEEADHFLENMFLVRYISTHSLTKRLTRISWNVLKLPAISTHSLTKRLTGTGQLPRFTPSHFNSQPHEEADCILYRWFCNIMYFNSQPHEEADGDRYQKPHTLHISTHSLTKRLTWYLFSWRTLLIFQLTASRRGWRRPLSETSYSSYFNSQPHEEADWLFILRPTATGISTHSLTKRLTAAYKTVLNIVDISTHSLTKRLTGKSRGRTGDSRISTHSLTKRLTS